MFNEEEFINFQLNLLKMFYIISNNFKYENLSKKKQRIKFNQWD